MPKVSAEHRESRREQIRQAALRCFAEKGFQRTTMADIVAASGLSPGAIYLQFEGKQQIVMEVGRQVLSRRLGELGELDHGDLPDPVAVMRLLVGGMVDEVVDPRVILQLWGEATSDPEMIGLVGEIFGMLGEAWTAYLRAWATGRGVADPAAWASTALPSILALTQGFLIQRTLVPEFDADVYFASIRAVAGPALLVPPDDPAPGRRIES